MAPTISLFACFFPCLPRESSFRHLLVLVLASSQEPGYLPLLIFPSLFLNSYRTTMSFYASCLTMLLNAQTFMGGNITSMNEIMVQKEPMRLLINLVMLYDCVHAQTHTCVHPCERARTHTCTHMHFILVVLFFTSVHPNIIRSIGHLPKCKNLSMWFMMSKQTHCTSWEGPHINENHIH